MGDRYLKEQILEDLEDKMVFLTGPRQVGKTTLSRNLFSECQYLNWDISKDREIILKEEWRPGFNNIIFDEIHKFPSWRNYLKGVYDEFKDTKKILVTGSGRLDFYRRGGDSLQGRYHFLRLHPFSVNELKLQSSNDLEDMMKLGLFPEPFLKGSEKKANRWSKEYRFRFLNEDIRDLESISDIGKLEILSSQFGNHVGSLFSSNSARENIQVAHATIEKWVAALERLFYVFRIYPFYSDLYRSLRKEPKLYLFHLLEIKSEAARFENLVALHLLKFVDYRNDAFGEDWKLQYLRDRDGRETDFAIIEDGEVKTLVECKLEESDIDKSLKYFKEKFPKAKAWQIHLRGKKNYESTNGIRVAPAIEFLKQFV